MDDNPAFAVYLAQLQANDRRYRYLRDHAQFETRGPVCISLENSRGHAKSALAEEDLDEAVDFMIDELGEDNI